MGDRKGWEEWKLEQHEKAISALTTCEKVKDLVQCEKEVEDLVQSDKVDENGELKTASEPFSKV